MEWVERAMENAAVETDERGLMPLAEARAIVAGAQAFRRGRGASRGGAWVWEADTLWAALLSLEAAEEFVREASRLVWRFHPRGKDNVAVVERYGENALPWLARFVDAEGRLRNVPWCVVPCLQALGGDSAFELVWSVRDVAEYEREGPGPFAPDAEGDVPEDFFAPTSALEAPTSDADGFAIGWVYAQGGAGFVALAKQAGTGDARACRMLRSLALCHPAEAFEPVRDALGEVEARALLARAEAPTELDARCVLALLVADDDWPALATDAPEDAFVALRLVAAREPEGDVWGVLLERVGGSDEASLRVDAWAWGVNAPGGHVETRELEAEEPDEEAIAALDLRPDAMTARGVFDPGPSVAARALVEKNAVFASHDVARQLLGLSDEAEILVETTRFAHVPPGTGSLRDVSTYRSLAEALAARDGARFEPGPPNTDFRTHAVWAVGTPEVDAGGGEA